MGSLLYGMQCMQRAARAAMQAVMRPPPLYFYIALSVLVVLETLGVVGSLYYAASVRNGNVSSASNVASESARALERLLDAQRAPILQVATAISMVSEDVWGWVTMCGDA